MLNLIINEYAKIFHKISTYILLGIILFMIITIPFGGYVLNLIDSSSVYVSYSDDDSEAAKIEDLIKQKCEDYNLSYTADESEDNWMANEIASLYHLYYPYNKDDVVTTVSLLENKDSWEEYYNAKIALLKKMEQNQQAIIEEKILAYRLKNNINPNEDNPLNKILVDYKDSLNSLDSNEWNKYLNDIHCFDKIDNSDYYNIKLCTYMLENNIDVPTIIENHSDVYNLDSVSSGYSNYVYNSKLYDGVNTAISILSSIVVIMLMVISANIVSKEFSKGTIKFLLITPVKRSKIFWSKFLTFTSYTFLLTMGVFILSLFFNFIITGDHGLNALLITYSDNKFSTHSAFLFELKNYLYAFFTIFIASVFSFTFSSLFRSSGLAISLSLVVYYVAGMIVSVALMLNLDFFRFTIFPVMDLKAVFDKTTGLTNLTPTFAFAVIGVHLFLMLFTAFDSFTRRNV